MSFCKLSSISPRPTSYNLNSLTAIYQLISHPFLLQVPLCRGIFSIYASTFAHKSSSPLIPLSFSPAAADYTVSVRVLSNVFQGIRLALRALHRNACIHESVRSGMCSLEIDGQFSMLTEKLQLQLILPTVVSSSQI